MKASKKVLSILLSLMLILCSSSMGLTVLAENEVEISADNFADENFRAILSEVYDTDENGYLSSTELSRKTMTLSGYLNDICGDDAVIETLDGIRYFSSLERLYCANIGLTSLDLSNNTALIQVTCQGNNLTSLILGNQPNLTWVNCSANALTSLNVMNCQKLQTLQCQSNSILTLNLSNNSMLTSLYCQQNELSNLNVVTNTRLEVIQCAHNHLWELNLSANTNLGETTSEMIGDQWVSANSSFSMGNIYIPHSFTNYSNLMSTSLDNVIETEEGQQRILAYTSGNFKTDDVKKIAGTLEDEEHRVRDGFTYKYNVNNSSCDGMTVNVEVSRNYYQVNFYFDETKASIISTALIMRGGNAAAPSLPANYGCKRAVGWSDTYTNIDCDKDIYVIWEDAHDMEVFIGDDAYIYMYCNNCDTQTRSFAFMDHYNSKRTDVNYLTSADMNEDGYVNAKDYAIIYRMKK